MAVSELLAAEIWERIKAKVQAAIDAASVVGGGGGTVSTLSHNQLTNVTANQHHQQAHILASAAGLGLDHLVAGLTAGQYLRALGADSAAFAAILDADLPATIVRTSRTITGTGALGGGGDLSANRAITMNLPGTLSVSSINEAAAAHTHAISASANPGAAASLLKTLSDGGLQLAYLGLGGAADPQFLLDVYGNAQVRGWIVGKHAIQVKGALMLCHYDGPEPYARDYTGEANGHMGQVATPGGGGVIYRPGKFGKGLSVGPTRTNLMRNPSAETNTTSWAAIYAATLSQSSEQAYVGTYAMKCVVTDGTSQAGIAQATATGLGGSSQTYSWQAKVYIGAITGTGLRTWVRFNYTDASFLDVGYSGYQTTIGEWLHLSGTATSDAVKTLNSITLSVRVHADTTATFYVDAAQVELGECPSPYIDGSLGSGHAWSGTAHESTSTRTVGHLVYKNPIVDPRKGTVMCWVFQEGRKTNADYFWCLGAANAELDGGIHSDAKAIFRLDGTLYSTGTVPLRTWTHLAYVWDFTVSPKVKKIYINGAVDGSATPATAPTLAANMVAFTLAATPTTYPLNGYADELGVIGRALDADEIKAIYESDAPIFAETSAWGWRSPSNKVWADADGLWAKDGSGNAVMGLACVDALSWGGTTLGLGDFMLGKVTNATTGANLIWDASAGKLQFRGGTTMQCEIGTDGALYADGGQVRLDSAGLTLIAPDGFSEGAIVSEDQFGGTLGILAFLYTPNDPPTSVLTRTGYLAVRSQGASEQWAKINIEADAGVSTSGSGNIYLHATAGDDTVSTLHLYSASASSAYASLNVDARIGGGLYVGGTATDPDAGDVYYTSDLRPVRGGTTYTSYTFVPLAAPLTSTAWDGDPYSDVATSTLIDLSAVFGAPAGIKAALVRLIARDSAATGTAGLYVGVGPSATNWSALAVHPVGNDCWVENTGPVACDANGDLYYQINASGAGTMDVTIQLHGYWL